jgi:hypothetical protein
LTPILTKTAGTLARHFHTPIPYWLDMAPDEMMSWMPVLEEIIEEEKPDG